MVEGGHDVAGAQLGRGPRLPGSTTPVARATGRSELTGRSRSDVLDRSEAGRSAATPSGMASRLRLVRRGAGAVSTSASQNGQIFHIGSSGLPHT